ncbi:MAG: hypothetical protein R2681_07960 [Pyrinomonadaceae bacterium]
MTTGRAKFSNRMCGLHSLFRFLPVLLIGMMLVIGCGSGLPELRPGFFEKPTAEENHGRISEKVYKFYNGPRTVSYKILEVDGSPVRIPEGFVKTTSYTKAAGIDAVAFIVRGKQKVAGHYILQVTDDKQHMIRLCDYTGFIGTWEDAVYRDCGLQWDAKTITMSKDPRFSDPPKKNQTFN